MPDIYTLLLLFVAIITFLVGGNSIANKAIKKRQAAGKTLSEIEKEFEIKKTVFTIISGVAFIFGATYSLYEFGLKVRTEDRQLLYGALGQLIKVDDTRPEISAAALLQLDRLGASSDAERPALVQIVTAYLNERARKPVTEHDDAITARPDIQMAIYGLSRLLDSDPNLGELVHLKEIDLRYVRIDKATLVNVKMIGVDFRSASIVSADFSGSDLTASLFKEAVLVDSNFSNATLYKVNFEGSDISSADFCNAKQFDNARFENVRAKAGAKCLQR